MQEERSRLVTNADVQRVAEARRRLREVKDILMTPSPEHLEACGPALEEAAGLLGPLLAQRKTGAGIPLLVREVEGLRRELAAVTALMQQASRYYLGWAQMLGTAAGGYNDHGEAALNAALTGESRLSVEG
jgi:hypothetical protein